VKICRLSNVELTAHEGDKENNVTMLKKWGESGDNGQTSTLQLDSNVAAFLSPCLRSKCVPNSISATRRDK
jgi:hypothetical protein